ncbi:Hypothetical predicted protein [Olea europaea subsp. europaea]|uniref:Uncharacterized protein n=1 Tax=Olea europaea subsp. europaea TaxID=158383 RepID=A0A8S0TRL9_OLEEU|nr:Hypothetical predicted protein [Olea europaea subsp. europaea]
MVVGVCCGGGGIQMGFCTLEEKCLFNQGDEMDCPINNLYYRILTGVLTISCSTLLVYLGGINGGWAAILEIVLCSILLTMMMLSYVAAYSVVYLLQDFTWGNGILRLQMNPQQTMLACLLMIGTFEVSACDS